MRRAIYSTTTDRALALLARAPWVHLASTTPEGAPVLRTVHTVLFDGHLSFHGADAGEKVSCLGREVVLGAEEALATLPSYVLDPERACPATTYYESAQVRGVLEAVHDLDRKAAILQALMERHQPEGGHAVIRADDPLYARVLEQLLVVQVRLDDVCGKLKVGQNRSPRQLTRIVEFLWRRGVPGDLETVELMRATMPELTLPDALVAPEGYRFMLRLDEARLEEAVELIAPTYWSQGFAREQVAVALRASHVVGVVEEGTERLVAIARAISDGTRHAWIYDVVVAEALRGRGLGESMMRLLLDHAAVRGARSVRLGTRDAEGFYARLGFVTVEEAGVGRPWRTIEMVRVG